MRGLTEEENLASGSNRSDPCSRSPSLPLVRLCIALAHLTFSVRERCKGGRGGRIVVRKTEAKERRCFEREEI